MNKLKWLQITMRASIVVLITVVAVTTAIAQPQVTRTLTGVEVGVCLITGTAMVGYLFQPLEHEKGEKGSK